MTGDDDHPARQSAQLQHPPVALPLPGAAVSRRLSRLSGVRDVAAVASSTSTARTSSASPTMPGPSPTAASGSRPSTTSSGCIIVPLLSTAFGLIIAVLADRLWWGNIAKSLVFMPMAISLRRRLGDLEIRLRLSRARASSRSACSTPSSPALGLPPQAWITIPLLELVLADGHPRSGSRPALPW